LLPKEKERDPRSRSWAGCPRHQERSTAKALHGCRWGHKHHRTQVPGRLWRIRGLSRGRSRRGRQKRRGRGGRQLGTRHTLKTFVTNLQYVDRPGGLRKRKGVVVCFCVCL
ncbi:unnamed protein product, partial [Ectocarpus sp. 13 AM-2016]